MITDRLTNCDYLIISRQSMSKGLNTDGESKTDDERL